MTARSIPQSNTSGQGDTRHTLSSGAYFDVKHENTPAKVSPFHSWVALRKANRVKRGNAAEKQYRVAIHADMMKITRPRPLTGVPEYKNTGGGIRGNVTGFSRASRKRMFEFMASIRHTGSMLFLTMTYDDVSLQREDFDMKAEFEAFRRRFERTFPTWQGLWRTEMQTRKSGELSGIDVPHYHIIIFTEVRYEDEQIQVISDSFRSWGAIAWQEITSSFDPYHLDYGFHCTPVRSRKHAYHYIGKYIGKADDDEHSIGRRWGRIGKFDTSISEKIHLDDNEIIALKRLIKRWLRNKNRRFSNRFGRSNAGKGFSVFGLGDTREDGSAVTILEGYNQFIVEIKRQAAIQAEYDRSYGN